MAAPVNDTPSGAIALTASPWVGSNVEATDNQTPLREFDLPYYGSLVWFTWTPRESGPVVIHTLGTRYADPSVGDPDTTLQVWTSTVGVPTSVDHLNDVVASDDGLEKTGSAALEPPLSLSDLSGYRGSEDNYLSGVGFDAEAGVTYWIAVGSYSTGSRTWFDPLVLNFPPVAGEIAQRGSRVSFVRPG